MSFITNETIAIIAPKKPKKTIDFDSILVILSCWWLYIAKAYLEDLSFMTPMSSLFIKLE
jgi:hypothetical protein